MFEASQQFFPTPDHVIEKMITPYIKDTYLGRRHLSWQGKLLEPSAGNGAMLDYLVKHWGDKYDRVQRQLCAIEIDFELRSILKSKGYNVIGSDFLDYNEPVEFGLILANPPFNEGVDHALKIWSLLAPGGDAAILLNRATIDNAHTEKRRKLVDLIDLHGTIEYLGPCFKDAERPTDVEVVCVRLTKPKQTRNGFEFNANGFDRDQVVDDTQFAANPLAHQDAIKNLVARYDCAVLAVKERLAAQSKLDFYLDGVDYPVTDSVKDLDAKALTETMPLFDQVRLLKSRFWNTVFTKTRLAQVTTSSFHRQFDEFVQTQAAMAFTEANIKEVLLMFFENRDAIMVDCVINIWDKLCAYHEDNKIHGEGWKTNKGWRLNKKVIHPYGVCFEPKYGGHWSTRHDYYQGGTYDTYNDLDKVMCYLDGQSIKDCTTINKAIQSACDRANRGGDYTAKFESTFFTLKMFKKGTVHLIFKDLELLNQMNRIVAKHRQWLGDGA